MSNTIKKRELDLPAIFGALGNPVRLKVYLKILNEACDCKVNEKGVLSGNCVTRIARSLRIPQPSVSHSVKELIHVGLVIGLKKGRTIYLFGTRQSSRLINEFGRLVEKEVLGQPRRNKVKAGHPHRL